MTSALNSRYLIDGVPQEHTPGQLLDAVSDSPLGCEPDGGTIIDETIDPSIEAHDWKPRDINKYLEKTGKARWQFPLPFSGVATRCLIARALIDALWHKGNFRLGDLALKAAWKWNEGPVGSQAAFYNSVLATADYVDALGLRLASCSYTPSAGASGVSFKAVLSHSAEEDDDMFDIPYRTRHARFSAQPACPQTLVPDSQSWLIYVPFDTSEYRLGGSLLAQSMGFGGGVSPQINDSDYFIDCFEVVRELVEDGVVLSGVTVAQGGLISAVNSLCAGGPGTTMDISDAVRAFNEPNIVRILFSEIPGAVIQIRDIDFDYVDAELLLQDVAFFPLGHPNLKSGAVRVRSAEKTGIQTILESLMQNAEGED